MGLNGQKAQYVFSQGVAPVRINPFILTPTLEGRKDSRMSKRAVITGITGQDGSHLAEFLLTQVYEVVGIVRRRSIESCDRISYLLEQHP